MARRAARSGAGTAWGAPLPTPLATGRTGHGQALASGPIPSGTAAHSISRCVTVQTDWYILTARRRATAVAVTGQAPVPVSRW